MKVLVTGGTGFIGLHLARRLISEGEEVVIVDNLSRGKADSSVSSLIDGGVKFIKCDLSETVPPDLGKDFDLVFHLAAINGTKYFYERPEEVLSVNIISLVNILKWLRLNKSKRIVFSSSSEAYSGTIRTENGPIPTDESVKLVIDDIFNPRLSYAISKIAGEALCFASEAQHSIDPVVVRLHNVYGPRMGTEHVIPEFLQRAKARSNPFQIYGGENTRSFCYVSDAVEGMLLAAKTRGEHRLFNIGNDKEEISMLHLANMIFDIFDYHPEVQVLRAPKGSVLRRVPDLTLARRALKYSAKVSLEDGLKRTLRGE